MRPLEIVLIICIILFVGGIAAWNIVKRVRGKKGGGGGSPCGCDCGACSADCGRKPAPQNDDGMPEIAVRSLVACELDGIADKMRADAEKKSDIIDKRKE